MVPEGSVEVYRRLAHLGQTVHHIGRQVHERDPWLRHWALLIRHVDDFASPESTLELEENSLTVTSQTHVESEEAAVLLGDQCLPPLRLDSLEHGVRRVRGLLIREIESGRQVAQQTARENGDVETRRLGAAIWPGQRSGFADNGVESALGVGRAAGELVFLPELEEPVGHQRSLGVEGLALDPERPWIGRVDRLAAIRERKRKAEERPDRLRRGGDVLIAHRLLRAELPDGRGGRCPSDSQAPTPARSSPNRNATGGAPDRAGPKWTSGSGRTA